MIEYIQITTDAAYQAAALLFKEYAQWLDIDLGFQNFSEELLQLKKMYGPPAGGIILAKNENDFVGSVAIRKIDTETAELKRMYVKPSSQKQGIGNRLVEEAILLAKKCGYKKIQLDTLNTMQPAIKLYKQYGFYEIPAYYYNPEKTAVYFEMIL